MSPVVKVYDSEVRMSPIVKVCDSEVRVPPVVKVCDSEVKVFIPSIIIGTINFCHCIPPSLTLTSPVGHKVSA